MQERIGKRAEAPRWLDGAVLRALPPPIRLRRSRRRLWRFAAVCDLPTVFLDQPAPGVGGFAGTELRVPR